MSKQAQFAFFLVAGFLLSNLCSPELVLGQFIQQPGGEEEDYGNYADEGYKNYSQEFLTLKQYDDFGNFLLTGLNVYRFADQHPAHGPSEFSRVNKYKYYTNWFENLVVAKDTYKGFATSFIVGDAIRTKFTSLTFDRSRFNGIRWDGAFRNNRFTLISSRVSDPIDMPFDTQVIPVLVGATHDWSRYLFGGHWESEIGDVLKLGLSYVNVHQTKSGYTSDESSMKGVVTECQPDTIALILADDSPEDLGNGPIVFSPPTLYVKRVDGTAISIVAGNQISYPVQVDGIKTEIFFFNVPGDAISATIQVVAANDFRFYTAHTYLPDQANPNYVKTSTARLVKRADGNVKDQSNKQIVKIDYALDTGRAIYGFNFEANVLGFRIKGEYELNDRYAKYPVFPGARSTETSHAYFLQAKKRLGPFTLGGEYFKIEPEYETAFSTHSHDATNTAHSNYHSMIQTVADTGGVYDWFVDDNDDNDRYHDGGWFYIDHNLSYTTNSYEVLNLDNPRQDAGIFPGLDENNDNIPDDDQNSNAIPDYQEPFMMYFRDPQRFDFGDDWNNNGIIDSRENDIWPDHLYRQDQTGSHYFAKFQPMSNLQLTYGTLRHDEIAGGGHNHVDYGKLEYQLDMPKYGQFNIYHVSKRASDNIKDPTFQFDEDAADYTVPKFTLDPLTMQHSVVHTSYLGANYRQIPNLNIETSIKHDLNFQKETSTQEKNYLDYWGIVGKADYAINLFNGVLNISPQLKYRWEMGTSQPDTWSPFGTKSAEADTFRHGAWWMPILRIDLHPTPKTYIRFGFQGFTSGSFQEYGGIDDTKKPPKGIHFGDLLSYQFRNGVSPEKSYNERIFMIMVTNASDYSGYKLQFNVGFQYIHQNYLDKDLRDPNYSRVFVRVLAGW